LSIALSRIRTSLPPLRGPVRRSAGESMWRRLSRLVKVVPLRFYLGAALALVLVGIGLNALVFQRERHPAPLFGSTLPAPAPAAPLAQKLPSPDHEASAALPPAAVPPVRPADGVDASSPAPSDPITDLLRGDARADGGRLVLAAQTALVKLGYQVKADGNDGLATQQALRDFERTHGLPLSTEITPRIVKQLSMAARATAR
jgi:hypothetical protein